MILFLKHIDIEGPGTIEEFFQCERWPMKTIDLHRGEKLPKDLQGIDGVVVLGGPMNVYEEDKYPFLKDEDVFIKKAIATQIPLLGICLGSQLIAKALGAKVKRSPVEEIGWYQLQLRPEAQKDPLMNSLAQNFDVFQWHGDTFDLPPGAVLLATSEGCPHQAYRIGKCVYAFQFHVEVTEAIIQDWCEEYFNSQDPELQKKAKGMVAAYRQKKEDFVKQSYGLYERFAALIEEKQKARV